mmetsp:Transcript_62177/g.157023  ORF Transcript_62177/g.157023 Transcript_62177/m.157023 type:complete len:245 (+) Transcript_62177:1337-2071(+)
MKEQKRRGNMLAASDHHGSSTTSPGVIWRNCACSWKSQNSTSGGMKPSASEKSWKAEASRRLAVRAWPITGAARLTEDVDSFGPSPALPASFASSMPLLLPRLTSPEGLLTTLAFASTGRSSLAASSLALAKICKRRTASHKGRCNWSWLTTSHNAPASQGCWPVLRIASSARVRTWGTMKSRNTRMSPHSSASRSLSAIRPAAGILITRCAMPASNERGARAPPAVGGGGGGALGGRRAGMQR